MPDNPNKEIHTLEVNGIKYLMIANAAGFATCINLIKEYKDNLNLRGLGIFITLFGTGLVLAAIAYAAALAERSYSISNDAEKQGGFSKSSVPAGFSLVIFCTAIVLLMSRLAHL
jgi:hypothetical protein